MQLKLIQLRDAPNYLGMDRHRFNKEVRPSLSIIPTGKQGITFDRLDLDTWVDDYKQCNERPANKRSKMIMGQRRMPGLLNRKGIWYIDKKILGQRICENTGSDSFKEAEIYLAKRIEEIRQAKVYGVRPKRGRITTIIL